MMTFKQLFNDLPALSSLNGDEYRFVKRDNNDLCVWRNDGKDYDVFKASFIKCSAKQFSVETLKRINIWNKLDKDVKEYIESGQALKDFDEARMDRMENISSTSKTKKRRKYKGVPDKLKCTECGVYTKIAASVLVNRCEKNDISIEDYIAGYKCQRCNPTRGRAKKDWGDVPNHMVCKCGHVQKYSQSAIVGMAKKKGLTVEAFVGQYVCQKCNPTRGKHKRDNN